MLIWNICVWIKIIIKTFQLLYQLFCCHLCPHRFQISLALLVLAGAIIRQFSPQFLLHDIHRISNTLRFCGWTWRLPLKVKKLQHFVRLLLPFPIIVPLKSLVSRSIYRSMIIQLFHYFTSTFFFHIPLGKCFLYYDGIPYFELPSGKFHFSNSCKDLDFFSGDGGGTDETDLGLYR